MVPTQSAKKDEKILQEFRDNQQKYVEGLYPNGNKIDRPFGYMYKGAPLVNKFIEFKSFDSQKLAIETVHWQVHQLLGTDTYDPKLQEIWRTQCNSVFKNILEFKTDEAIELADLCLGLQYNHCYDHKISEELLFENYGYLVDQLMAMNSSKSGQLALEKAELRVIMAKEQYSSLSHKKTEALRQLSKTKSTFEKYKAIKPE